MVQKFKSLSDVIALAEFAHRNQIDKSGQPYIDHPKRVLQKVQAQGALPYVQAAAVLHDVTEDTAFTPQMLLDLGISEATVEVVKLVDRHESEIVYYQQFVGNGDDPSVDEFYYKNIRANPAALMVKFADIEDNLSPWRLSYLAPKTQERLKAKYAKALKILDGRSEFCK